MKTDIKIEINSEITQEQLICLIDEIIRISEIIGIKLKVT